MSAAAEAAAPRPHTPGWVDTWPQDAAVDPTVEAYVKPEGPVGEADPHGPEIVHPGLPGVDPKPGFRFPEADDTAVPEPAPSRCPRDRPRSRPPRPRRPAGGRAATDERGRS